MSLSSVLTRNAALCVALVSPFGCKSDKPEPEPEPAEQPELAVGEVCDPSVERIADEDLQEADTDGSELPAVCSVGLACEPVADSEGDFVCGVAVEIRGRVTDSKDGAAVEGALVAALNENGEPITDVVVTDACGDYVLPVSILRDSSGEYTETPKWTLNVAAQDYLPFPEGVRPALPVDIADAVADPDPPPEPEAEMDGATDGDEPMLYVKSVIDNAATNVVLIPLPEDEQSGGQVSGTVQGELAAGTLVVAEGTGGRTPHGIADRSGAYTVFNVPPGDATIRGYRQNLELAPADVSVGDAPVDGVDLAAVSEDPGALATVTGSLNIVNAPGGSVTSVVLVPVSAYIDALERGPVPIGLRVPEPPAAPDVTSAFEFRGVPAGTYKVLVAFENDDLVRDPDEGIAGTAIVELTVNMGDAAVVDPSFKVTEGLAVVGPGADAPEAVDGAPVLSFADDSSEDGYQVVVFNALGDLVWETEIPGVSGADVVEVPYEGPTLVAGMYYQFRATSFRERPNGDRTFISRTEDLRGVFVSGEAAALAECEASDGDTETDGSSSGG